MLKELERFLEHLRPAFSRRATHAWFIVVFIGFVVRADTYGVSSIVRALALPPSAYLCLLHFFHSNAWRVDGLMGLWWDWLVAKNAAYRMGNRIVLVGDHTKIPKGARKMPAVTTLHQDSETSSKPSFFRGHHWGCIGVLMQAGSKFFAVPLWATIQEGGINGSQRNDPPKTVRIVQMALRVACAMNTEAFLVLDAYFAVGPVFQTAQMLGEAGKRLYILTRAKKNVTAYQPAPKKKKNRRGPQKKYGKKLKLMRLFELKAYAACFQSAPASIYGREETIRYLAFNLLWKPTQGLIRFILVESSRGRMVLMTSDLALDPVTAVELYCRRVTIETLFDTLKNTLGGLAYHFWSLYLNPISRRPIKNEKAQRSSSPTQTQATLDAIEKFVNVQLLVLGMLQLTAKHFPQEVYAKALCWLRTVSANTPSEFVTRMALANVIKANLCGLAKSLITVIIQLKQKCAA